MSCVHVRKRLFTGFISFVLCLALNAVCVFAVNFPSLKLKNSSISATVGESIDYGFFYNAAYEKERTVIRVYDPEGKEIRKSSFDWNASNNSSSVEHSVIWDTRGYHTGKYKVVATLEYYHEGTWLTVPNTTVWWITLSCTHEWGQGELVPSDPVAHKPAKMVYTCQKCKETKEEILESVTESLIEKINSLRSKISLIGLKNLIDVKSLLDGKNLIDVKSLLNGKNLIDLKNLIDEKLVEEIEEIRDKYNQLRDAQKSLIPNVSILENAEIIVQAVKKAAEEAAEEAAEKKAAEEAEKKAEKKKAADKISPILKAPASLKVKVKKNKAAVSWKKIKRTKKTKKLLSQIKYIQIQYATDPRFKRSTVWKVNKNKTKVTLKLKKKKTYYIRVRYVGKDGVSKWTKVKKMKSR